jgi:predicted metal-dependent enzyme (double-stranded beta helix superfamily)
MAPKSKQAQPIEPTSESWRLFLADINSAAKKYNYTDAISDILAKYLKNQQLLDGLMYRFYTQNYSRHLVYADAAGRFSLLAIVWPPGKQSPLHAHYTWCIFGMHSGTITESTGYLSANEKDPNEDELEARQLLPGEVSYDPGDGRYVHRMSNYSTGLAVSLHIYGVSSDKINSSINRIISP